MKKTLLLFATMLFSLVASAGDGLVAVGANVILLPSSYWDGDIEWKAWTWVYNTGMDYGSPYGVDNANYNIICGFPSDDSNDREWFEPDYDMGPKEEDFNEDLDQAIVWEEHLAPFSSDETFHNRTSYRWTTNNIMADIYVRRTFTIPAGQLLAGPVYLACGHDDAPAQYFLNGELVYERTGFETNDDGNILNGWNNAEYILLTDEQKALIKLNGEENIIAFSVHQNWGGAFADCGLYTKAEGGLDMGYTTPWEGKVLFNNFGGFGGHIINNQPDLSTTHPWSKLYEAQAGDEYTFLLEGASKDDYNYEEWREQLDFKTPIKIEDGHTYSFKARIEADKPFAALIVKLGDNDNDDIELAYEEMTVEAPEEGYEEDYEGTLVDIEFYGEEVNNFRISFDFGGGQDSTNVVIKEMSLRDITEGEEEAPELWVGTHYFNFFDMYKTVVKYLIYDEELGDYREATEEEREWAEEVVEYEPVDAPEINGRVETLAWTQADFDDSMWDDQMMPVGSADYTYRESEWPGGDNTNYWIRRNFELDKVNDRLSYELNVCHDDTYETYVNGHLLQKNTGWTDGKNPVQVHIPAKYLNVGKNVIATYIQQNWGGKFYDCGINVMEVNYEECVQTFNDAIAFAEESTNALLTNKMKDNIKALIAEAKQYFTENQNDPAELRNYAREMKTKINAILAYSPAVKTLKDTYDICCKMEDKGYWGTALDDVIAALDTCATANDLNKYIAPLREARKATAMERRTEKFVGSAPQAVSSELIGWTDYFDFEDQVVPRYYLYNVGAKLFLGAGEDWGTHLALEYASNAMMIIQAMQNVVDEESGEVIDETPLEGAYYVETYRPNGEIGVGDFMGWNGYIDVGIGSTWEFIPVEGKPNVYNIAQYGQTFTAEGKTYAGTAYEPGGKKYLGLRSGDNAYTPSYYIVDTDLHSPELETNQWMFISREEMLGFLATATEENPADLTFLIENPGYDQRWTIDNWYFSNGSVLGRGGNNPQFVFEAYNAEDFWMAQDLWPEEGEEALPAGTYVLEVQGYYRDGIEATHVTKVLANNPIEQLALIFAGIMEDSQSAEEIMNSETMPLMPIHIEANKVPGIGYGADQGLQMPGTYSGQPINAVGQAGQEYFPCGLYWNKLAFKLDEPTDHLNIGIFKDYSENRSAGDWCVMDNWRLKYYGTNVEDPDAIQGVVSDEINQIGTVSKSIYNMLGQRLSKTQKGVNIINGKKIIKK